jgi:hypothetical protein
MVIGDIVARIQIGIWITALLLFIGRIAVKTARGESVMPVWLRCFLSFNIVIGVVIVLGLLMSGISLYYLNLSSPRLKRFSIDRMESVHDRSFINESVEIDGKYFFTCKFINVRLIFHGDKEFMFKNNYFDGIILITTEKNSGMDAATSLIVQLLRDGSFVNPNEVGFDSEHNIIIRKLEK